jgi:uncharacterized protein
MTSIAAPATVSLLARVRNFAPEIVAGALGLTLLHLFGEVSFARDDGTSAWDGLGGIAVPAAVALGVAVVFHRLPAALQAWGALVIGSLAAADGIIHIDHWRETGSPTAEDVLGLLAAAGGVVLLALAVVIALRPKEPRPRLSRWGLRGVSAGVVTLTFLFVVLPVGTAVYYVHKPAIALPATVLGLDAKPVTLHTEDGLELAGSYVAGHNGGVVILVHGSGGDHSGGIRSRAEVLVRNGYGVLAYDARGGGNSEGRPERLGWTWSRDVAAAVDFLRSQGFKPERIGALGLSTGAEAVLERAGEDERIAAVVAEGAQARTLEEVRLLHDAAEEAYVGATFVVSLTAYSVLRQVSEPPPLVEMIPRISPRPVLLLSSGSGYERELNRAYARSARWPSALWELPGAPHTGALKERPVEYERRIVGFFDRALLGL